MYRTMLFAPANNPRRVEKAFQVEADAVIVDLEDAVAPSEKESARRALRTTIPPQRSVPVYVRVNGFGTEHVMEDLCAAVNSKVDGVVLPKVESPDHLIIADWMLSQYERQFDLPIGSIAILPHVESALGLSCMLPAFKASKRVRVAGFGGGDFATDLRLNPSRDESELIPYRAAVVLASRQGGLEAPIDSVWSHLADKEGLRATAEVSRRSGFQGKRCIHPEQVLIVNEVFSPTPSEIAWAERIVDSFEEAISRGLAAIKVGDEFVDLPVVERARRVLSIREKMKQR